jgi:hypothetical protein
LEEIIATTLMQKAQAAIKMIVILFLAEYSTTNKETGYDSN